MSVAYPEAAASSQAEDIDASVDLTRVALIKRQKLLRSFSRALNIAQKEADEVLSPRFDRYPDLDISPDGIPTDTISLLVGFCSERTGAWMEWIASHGDEDEFDLGEFNKFVPGLLTSPTEVWHHTPLDQCLYSWLLQEVDNPRYIRSRSAYESAKKRLSKAVYEAHTWYANILCYANNLDAFDFEPTPHAGEGSNVSEGSTSEVESAADDENMGSGSESGTEDSDRKPTASLSPNTVCLSKSD
jgi:hypothetical protein